MIMNDLESSMLSYHGIYYEKFRKIMQRTEKEALILSVLWGSTRIPAHASQTDIPDIYCGIRLSGLQRSSKQSFNMCSSVD